MNNKNPLKEKTIKNTKKKSTIDYSNVNINAESEVLNDELDVVQEEHENWAYNLDENDILDNKEKDEQNNLIWNETTEDNMDEEIDNNIFSSQKLKNILIKYFNDNELEIFYDYIIDNKKIDKNSDEYKIFKQLNLKLSKTEIIEEFEDIFSMIYDIINNNNKIITKNILFDKLNLNVTINELNSITSIHQKLYYIQNNKLIKNCYIDDSLWEYFLLSLHKISINYFDERQVPDKMQHFLIICKNKLEENWYVDIDMNIIQNALQYLNYICIFKDTIWLTSFEEINPKTIVKKAELVLRDIDEPLHFKNLTIKINEYFINEKPVKQITVYNELVKNKDIFVNIWLWTYWLKEWWFKWGKLKELIINIMEQNNRPMSVWEIWRKVLMEKIVNEWTIILTLKKYKEFKQIDKWIYVLNK